MIGRDQILERKRPLDEHSNVVGIAYLRALEKQQVHLEEILLGARIALGAVNVLETDSPDDQSATRLDAQCRRRIRFVKMGNIGDRLEFRPQYWRFLENDTRILA